jgi:hypothetical protein
MAVLRADPTKGMASAPDAMKSAALVSIPVAVTAQKADSRIDLSIKLSGLKTNL